MLASDVWIEKLAILSHEDDIEFDERSNWVVLGAYGNH